MAGIPKTVCFRLEPDPAAAERLADLARRYQAMRRHAYRRLAKGQRVVAADLRRLTVAPSLPADYINEAILDAQDTLRRHVQGLLERLPRRIEKLQTRIAEYTRLIPTVGRGRRRGLRQKLRRCMRWLYELQRIQDAKDGKKAQLTKAYVARRVFGGKENFAWLCRGGPSEKERRRILGEWGLRRRAYFARRGRRREAHGNEYFQIAWDPDGRPVGVHIAIAITPVGRRPRTEYIEVPLRSRHRDLREFRDLTEPPDGAAPVPWTGMVVRRCRTPERHVEERGGRLRPTGRPCPGCRFYLHASYEAPAPAPLEPTGGVVGVDLNASARHVLACAHVGPDGNLKSVQSFSLTPTRRERRALARRDRRRLQGREYQGVRRDKRPVVPRDRIRKFIETAAFRIVQYAREHQAAIALEDNLFKEKPLRGQGYRATRRLLARWPVRTTQALIERAAGRLGVPVLRVPAAYTSRIGLAKYAPLHNLAVHQGAATVLGRLGAAALRGLPDDPEERDARLRERLRRWACDLERLPKAWTTALSASGPGSPKGPGRGRRKKPGSAKPPSAAKLWEGAARRAETMLRARGARSPSALKAFLCAPAQPQPGVRGACGRGSRGHPQPPVCTTGGRMQPLPLPPRGPRLCRGP